MRLFSPHGTLILLLAAAAVILLGGSRLARRTERVRTPGDRAPIQILAGELGGELGRLERLYESHLNQLAKATASMDHQEIWLRCNDVIGVSQWSLIHPESSADPDIHWPIDLSRSSRLPEPAIRVNPGSFPHARVLLSGDELFHPGEETSGWIDEPGKPLFFWRRVNGESAVVLLIDRTPLLAALDPWLTEWAAGAFAPVRAAKEAVTVISPDGGTIAGAGTAQNTGPDFLLPIRSRFGTWGIAAWDRVETRVFYDVPTQVASAVLAVFVALLGVFGFVQQRRMLVLAAQRVSFVNRVSHELRTPMTNILLNLDLIADGLEDEPAAREPSRRLGMVAEEAQRLGRLIENVLAFSRKERGQLQSQCRACVPDGIVAAVAEQFAPSFARRGLSLRVAGSVPTACLLDADALAQILSNLLSNVEKYVPGGIVEIGMRLANETLAVTVTDQGPGIPARAAERIFQPFERIESRVSEGASGAGLGLAIARDLAGNAGGSLRLVPAARGASFELLLPAPPAAVPRAISA